MPLIGWFLLLVAAAVAVVWLVGRGAGLSRAPRPLRAVGAALLWRRRLGSDTQLLLDAVDEGMLLVAAAGTVRAANSRAADILLPERPFVETMFHEAHLVELIAGADAAEAARVEAWWQEQVAAAVPGHGPLPTTYIHTVGRERDTAVGLEVVAVEGSLGQPLMVVRVTTGPVRQGRVGAPWGTDFMGAFDSALQPMAVTAADGAFIDVNIAFAETLGEDPHRLHGRHLREFTHRDDGPMATEAWARLELGVVGRVDLEQRVRRADGEFRQTAVRIDRLHVAGGEGSSYVVHLRDLTEQREAVRRLTLRERHDPLTGLINRVALTEVLGDLLDGAAPDTVGVVQLNLDQFTLVNESLGQAGGDLVLRQVAARVQSATLGADQLGRLGGDEFVILLDGGGGRVDARAAAERVRRALAAPVVVDGEEIFLTASIGYAVSLGTDDAEAILARVDAAVRHAKQEGRDAVVDALRLTSRRDGAGLRIASELRRGLPRNELVPFFQPILSLRSGRVTGYEVLARWNHPERGLLGPGEFMAQAEESGIMLELGAAMLRGALIQLRDWRRDAPVFERRTVSVNVATRQLTDPGFYHSVVDILEEVGIGGESLWLEITETSLLSDVAGVMAALTDLRRLGIRFAVDDFGTGYSSLTYLKRFPVEAIKIDRSFVSGLGSDADDTAIVDAVVRLGAALDLTVVAEGVETKDQARALQALGCDRGQGYLFGRPVAAGDVSRI